MHVVRAARAHRDADVAVAPQDVARSRLGNRADVARRRVLRLALVRQRDAHLAIRPRDQTGAVERVGTLGTPDVGAADAAHGVAHDRVVGADRTARVHDGPAATAAGGAATAAAGRAAAATGVAGVRRGLRLTLALGLGGSFRRRCGSRCGLLLLEELLGLGVEGADQLGGLIDLGLDLALDLLGFFGLGRGDLLLAGVLVLGGLKLFAQGLRLVDHVGVVLVHLVEEIPVLGELFERGGTQDEIDEARRSVAVHVAGTRAQLVLQIADLAVSVVDFGLLGLHRRLRGIALVERGVIADFGSLEIGLQTDQLVAHRIGFGLLLSSGLGEGGRRSHDGEGTERSRAGEKCSPAQSDCMLAHV